MAKKSKKKSVTKRVVNAAKKVVKKAKKAVKKVMPKKKKRSLSADDRGHLHLKNQARAAR
jgi:hypothetical protein